MGDEVDIENWSQPSDRSVPRMPAAGRRPPPARNGEQAAPSLNAADEERVTSLLDGITRETSQLSGYFSSSPTDDPLTPGGERFAAFSGRNARFGCYNRPIPDRFDGCPAANRPRCAGDVRPRYVRS